VGRGWLFVAKKKKKKHKEDGEVKEGERRVNCQIIN
jgi:hypothetical protein